jgi:hypothetical protein
LTVSLKVSFYIYKNKKRERKKERKREKERKKERIYKKRMNE